jgi:hypothetical protein
MCYLFDWEYGFVSLQPGQVGILMLASRFVFMYSYLDTLYPTIMKNMR